MGDRPAGRRNQETGHCWGLCWTQRGLLPAPVPLRVPSLWPNPDRSQRHKSLGNAACKGQKAPAVKQGRKRLRNASGPAHNPLKEVSSKKEEKNHFQTKRFCGIHILLCRNSPVNSHLPSLDSYFPHKCTKCQPHVKHCVRGCADTSGSHISSCPQGADASSSTHTIPPSTPLDRPVLQANGRHPFLFLLSPIVGTMTCD